ncbi:MAG: DUF4174 domain-containing protein [Pseudomonadota bacterium]
MMRKELFSLVLAGTLAAGSAGATDATIPQTVIDAWNADRTQVFDAADIDLDDLKWLARPVVVFADSPANPVFQEQLDLLEAGISELVERDVILIVDTDPDAESALRTKLRPREFMLVLIGKDGGVKLRKPFAWDVRELSRSIDKMPMRQQEIRDANG